MKTKIGEVYKPLILMKVINMKKTVVGVMLFPPHENGGLRGMEPS